MPVSSYHYLEGPLIAVAALGVIVLLCRWVFSTDHRTSAPSPGESARDLGLLRPVSTVRSETDAHALRTLLLAEGIRCTVSTTGAGWEVLVFVEDVDRARALVRS